MRALPLYVALLAVLVAMLVSGCQQAADDSIAEGRPVPDDYVLPEPRPVDRFIGKWSKEDFTEGPTATKIDDNTITISESNNVIMAHIDITYVTDYGMRRAGDVDSSDWQVRMDETNGTLVSDDGGTLYIDEETGCLVILGGGEKMVYTRVE